VLRARRFVPSKRSALWCEIHFWPVSLHSNKTNHTLYAAMFFRNFQGFQDIVQVCPLYAPGCGKNGHPRLAAVALLLATASGALLLISALSCSPQAPTTKKRSFIKPHRQLQFANSPN